MLPTTSVGQAQEDDSPAESQEPDLPPPRGNSEFFGSRTTARITRRFEMYNPHSVEALAALKEMGFTQVMLDWPNFHAEATARGLDVVLANWWTDKTPPAEIDRGVELAQEVEAGRLAGLSVMDEPGRNSPETPFGFYMDLYADLRPKLDSAVPGVPVEISHWGPLESWDQRYYDYFSYLYEAADLMRIMPYPDLNEGPLGDVYLMMLRSREMMNIAERDLPLLVILQTWVLPPKSELPQIEELRVMAYQAMLGGAEVVSFFDYNEEVWAKAPEFHDQFRELMAELRQFSDALQDASVESWMNGDMILRAEARWPSGHVQSIQVNTNRMAVAGLAPLAIIIEPKRQSSAYPQHQYVQRCCPPHSHCYRSDTTVRRHRVLQRCCRWHRRSCRR